MKRKEDERIREARGRKSRQTGKLNQLEVLIAVMGNPSTFSQLLKKTGFSRPVLSKHLKFWTSGGLVYKDTIKKAEATNPKDVGKIVYRTFPGTHIPKMVEAMETALQLPKLYWTPESRTELREHLKAIAEIMLYEVSIYPNQTYADPSENAHITSPLEKTNNK